MYIDTRNSKFESCDDDRGGRKHDIGLEQRDLKMVDSEAGLRRGHHGKIAAVAGGIVEMLGNPDKMVGGHDESCLFEAKEGQVDACEEGLDVDREVAKGPVEIESSLAVGEQQVVEGGNRKRKSI